MHRMAESVAGSCRNRRVAGLLVIFWTAWAWAIAADPGVEPLYSPAAAALLSRVGMDAYSLDPYSSRTIEKTMTFLEASLILDDQIGTSWENLLKVSASGMTNPNDYSIQIRDALRQYVNEQANLAVINQAVAYLLGRQNTRLDREVALAKLLHIYQERSPAFVSELYTQMALLEIERADFTSALGHLNQAYMLDPYNSLAFSKFVEITALSDTPIPIVHFVLQLRRALEANPLDLRIAKAYADILRQTQLYEAAQKAYQYSADLYGYLYPGRPVPLEILQPWSLCAFQTERTLNLCLVLADQAASDGRADLSLEAMAGLAAIHLGQSEKGRQRLETAAQSAARQVKQTGGSSTVMPENLCWFYNFVLPDPEQALAWGHEAVSVHPDSMEARALFAYALAQNGQDGPAQEYIQGAPQNDPVILFTKSLIMINEEKTAEALPALKTVVSSGPETLVGYRAAQLLKKNGSEYISPIVSSEILNELKAEFGDQITGKMAPLSQLIRAKLSMSGSEYMYGSDLQASVVIENIGQRNLIISDTGLFKGLIRIDAQVNGDLRKSIPALIETQIRPGRMIRPGQHAAVSVNLMQGQLRTLLRTHPQASVEVELTLRLDPPQEGQEITGKDGLHLAPVSQTLRRRGIELTRDFLMQRLDGVARGKEGQKYRSAELFTGLLAEQYAARSQKVDYRFVRAEPQLLLDAVRRLLADNDWIIRLQTMATFTDVTLPMEYSLIDSVSDNLSHERWPVRMMALFVLSQKESTNFNSVLDWTSRYDPCLLNRRMAVALGGQAVTAEVESTQLPKEVQEVPSTK